MAFKSTSYSVDWPTSITLSIGIILGLMAVWAELPLNATGLAGLVFSGITEYDVGLAMPWESKKEKASSSRRVAHEPGNLWGSTVPERSCNRSVTNTASSWKKEAVNSIKSTQKGLGFGKGLLSVDHVVELLSEADVLVERSEFTMLQRI